jgi:hypothetical protein
LTVFSLVYWKSTLVVYRLAPGEPDEGLECPTDLKMHFGM